MKNRVARRRTLPLGREMNGKTFQQHKVTKTRRENFEKRSHFDLFSRSIERIDRIRLKKKISKNNKNDVKVKQQNEITTKTFLFVCSAMNQILSKSVGTNSSQNGFHNEDEENDDGSDGKEKNDVGFFFDFVDRSFENLLVSIVGFLKAKPVKFQT